MNQPVPDTEAHNDPNSVYCSWKSAGAVYEGEKRKKFEAALKKITPSFDDDWVAKTKTGKTFKPIPKPHNTIPQAACNLAWFTEDTLPLRAVRAIHTALAKVRHTHGLFHRVCGFSTHCEILLDSHEFHSLCCALWFFCRSTLWWIWPG